MNRSIVLQLVALGIVAVGCNNAPSSSAPAASAQPTASAPASKPPPPAASATAASATAAPAGSVAKIAPDKINAASKAVADRVAKAYFDGLTSGKFADVDDLADTMKAVTPAQWKGVFDATTAKYGAYKANTFADAWDDEKGGSWYRYSATFAKAPKVEFRVDLNGQNKSTKFGTYDWIDATP